MLLTLAVIGTAVIPPFVEQFNELVLKLPQAASTLLDLLQDWMRQASEIDRQDHELAGNIARDLYYLDLPEEGDYWLSRVQTLAPRSGIARALEVARAAGADLDCRYTLGANAFGVVLGLEVAFDHRDA